MTPACAEEVESSFRTESDKDEYYHSTEKDEHFGKFMKKLVKEVAGLKKTMRKSSMRVKERRR